MARYHYVPIDTTGITKCTLATSPALVALPAHNISLSDLSIPREFHFRRFSLDPSYKSNLHSVLYLIGGQSPALCARELSQHRPSQPGQDALPLSLTLTSLHPESRFLDFGLTPLQWRFAVSALLRVRILLSQL